MDKDDRNYAETIKLLKKELKSKENDVQLAAKYGKQLLEERDAALSQIEVLKQENYSLQLNLKTQRESARSQASELESCVKQVNRLEEDIPALEKEVAVLKQKNDNYLKEVHALEKNVEDMQLENSALKSKVTLLQEQIETYKNVSILNDTGCEEDLPDINAYISKIKTLEDAMGKLQYELESTKLNEKRLMQSVKGLEEALSDRDHELSSEVQRVTDLQETVAELQCEIESLKFSQFDVKRKGNSMFGELDDRRKYAEKLYKELYEKYKNMLTKYEENKNELIYCKGQLIILQTKTSKKHHEEQIRNLRLMLSEALRRKEELIIKLGQAEQIQQNAPQTIVKGDQYNYLKIMNEQAQKKMIKVENELMSERQRALDFEKKLSDCYQQLFMCQEAIQEKEIENLTLKEQLKEATTRPDAAVPSEPKVNIEILPGYESNPESQKIVEKILKENTEPQDDGLVIPGVLMMGENGFVEVEPPRPSTKARMRLSPVPAKNSVPAESALKEANKQEDKVLAEVADKHPKPLNIAENKKVNCAQQ